MSLVIRKKPLKPLFCNTPFKINALFETFRITAIYKPLFRIGWISSSNAKNSKIDPFHRSNVGPIAKTQFSRAPRSTMTNHPIHDSFFIAANEFRIISSRCEGDERQKFLDLSRQMLEAADTYAGEYWQLIDERFKNLAYMQLLKNWRQSFGGPHDMPDHILALATDAATAAILDADDPHLAALFEAKNALTHYPEFANAESVLLYRLNNYLRGN